MPLIITTTVFGELFLTCGIMSRPLMPGIVISLTTSSYSLLRNNASACSAEPAVVQSYLPKKRSERIAVISGSSSTISIRGLASAGIFPTPNSGGFGDNYESAATLGNSLGIVGEVRVFGDFVPCSGKPLDSTDFAPMWQTCFYMPI